MLISLLSLAGSRPGTVLLWYFVQVFFSSSEVNGSIAEKKRKEKKKLQRLVSDLLLKLRV